MLRWRYEGSELVVQEEKASLLIYSCSNSQLNLLINIYRVLKLIFGFFMVRGALNSQQGDVIVLGSIISVCR